MKHLYPVIICCSFLLNTFNVNSQTVTIDYSNEAFNDALCHIFSNSPTIDGHVHQTVLGRPRSATTGTSTKWVVLYEQESTSPNVRSTQYTIAYPFKNGFKYRVSISCYGIKNFVDGFYPLVAARLRSSGGSVTATDCIPTPLFNLGDATGFNPQAVASTQGWVTAIDWTTLNQSYSHLEIASLPWPLTTF